MPSLPTSKFASLIPSTSKTDIPIGLNLMGEHVLSTLASVPWCPDLCRRNAGENPGLRWKTKITNMHWPARISPGSSEYFSSMTSVPPRRKRPSVGGALRRPYGRSRSAELDSHTETPTVCPSSCLLSLRGTALGESACIQCEMVERFLAPFALPGSRAVTAARGKADIKVRDLTYRYVGSERLGMSFLRFALRDIATGLYIVGQLAATRHSLPPTLL